MDILLLGGPYAWTTINTDSYDYLIPIYSPPPCKVTNTEPYKEITEYYRYIISREGVMTYDGVIEM